MSPKANLIFLLAAFLCHEKLHAQEKLDLKKLMPKKFIDKWEIVIGPNYNLLNADNWKSYYNSNTPNSSYSISNKWGFSSGLGLNHNISNRIQLKGKLLYERRGFFENYSFSSGSFTNTSYDQRDDCLSLSFIPGYYLTEKKIFRPLLGLVIPI